MKEKCLENSFGVICIERDSPLLTYFLDDNVFFANSQIFKKNVACLELDLPYHFKCISTERL